MGSSPSWNSLLHFNKVPNCKKKMIYQTPTKLLIDTK